MAQQMELVQRLIKKFNTADPFALCDCLDIIVLHVPLVGIRGFYQFINGSHIIYIAQDLPAHLQRFVCAHELGHALLHGQDNALYLSSCTYLVAGKLEKAANEFAVCLLYPDDNVLIEYLACSTTELTAIMGVPQKLAQYRIDMLKDKQK